MANMAVYGKTPQRSYSIELVEQFSHEFLYVVKGTPARHSLFKLCPWVDLDLLLARLVLKHKL